MWTEADILDLEHEGLLDKEADESLEQLDDDGLDYFVDEALDAQLAELDLEDEDGWDEDIESWDDL